MLKQKNKKIFQKSIDNPGFIGYNIDIEKREEHTKVTKVEMVKKMMENGYHLFNETAEQFADRIPQAVMESIYHAYMKRVGQE